MKFSELGLPEKILNSLAKIEYENLTPIQEQIIPSIQEGRDVLGCSQTGSGKTGAFLVPILSKLIEDKKRKAIVVAPTRELAMQIMDNAKLFLNKDKDINKALIIGGASIRDQLLSIKNDPRLIIGTPGRINDFLDSGKLVIGDFDILVLDEMDRMLDMGFSVQIDEITKRIAKKRQTMLFSATISKKIEKVTEKYLKDPVVIKIGDTNQPSVNISQEIINAENDEKFAILLEKLRENTTFTLVFVKTKHSTEKIADKLDRENIMAKAIHGDLKQNKRAKIIQDFRDKKFNVLVATDVAARGLDIHHIDTVINYDLPQSPEDYIHRIGRCSRGMEVKGTSISFCCRNEKKLLEAIRSLIKNGEYSEDIGFNRNDEKSRRKSSGSTSNRFRGGKPNTNSKRGNRNIENKIVNNTDAFDIKEGSEGRLNKSSRSKAGANKKTAPSNQRPGKKSDATKSEGTKKSFNKKDSGYDIEGLMSNGKSRSPKVKRPSSYLISKTTTQERRKKLGL